MELIDNDNPILSSIAHLTFGRTITPTPMPIYYNTTTIIAK